MDFSGSGISFILTEPRDSGFESKIRARFGIESIVGGGMRQMLQMMSKLLCVFADGRFMSGFKVIAGEGRGV